MPHRCNVHLVSNEKRWYIKPSIGFKVSNLINSNESKYYDYFGKNCITDFFECVQKEALKNYETCLCSKAAKPIIFTKED